MSKRIWETLIQENPETGTQEVVWWFVLLAEVWDRNLMDGVVPKDLTDLRLIRGLAAYANDEPVCDYFMEVEFMRALDMLQASSLDDCRMILMGMQTRLAMIYTAWTAALRLTGPKGIA